MKEIILVKNGELALKGLNRSSFEDKLVKILSIKFQTSAILNLQKVSQLLWLNRLMMISTLMRRLKEFHVFSALPLFHVRANVKRI